MNNNIDILLQELIDILDTHKKGLVTKESLEDHIHALSIYVAIESRTDEEKSEIKSKSQSNQASEVIEKLLLEYISADQYTEIYKKTALHIIDYYVTNMIPTVPEDIQIQLNDYLKKIK
ncbi:hypothetical protein KBC70_03820 [Candidatus Woesebacteria bacterium]|nr:hypothetical protein [Candidatus Woesebacteria bacterium]